MKLRDKKFEKQVEEVLKFIRTYGPEADYAPDEVLRKELFWYMQSNLALVVRDDYGIVGVLTYQPIRSPHEIHPDRWPETDLNGRYLYLTKMVLHPLHRGRLVLAGYLRYCRKVYPRVKYVVYRRGDAFRQSTSVIDVNHFEKEVLSHGR